MFIAANHIKGKKDIKFSVVRYGNVFGSRGSVYPVFKNFVNKGYFPITDKNMTRFNITIEEGVELVIKTLKTAIGGEIIIPKLKSFRIVDLAKALNKRNALRVIGIRSGEKMHEQMITKSDSYDTLETKDSYIILPPKILDEVNYNKVFNHYKKKFKAKKVKAGFEYSSDQNGKFLSINEIKKIINS